MSTTIAYPSHFIEYDNYFIGFPVGAVTVKTRISFCGTFQDQ
ncbi:hypothetical protein [uncultured Paraglaciecola sp.]|nr:hypothetical protein [uncultured Paraglaciecola sp.]